MRKGTRAIEVDGHRDEVIKMVVESIPYTEIARRFGYDDNSVRAYVKEKLMRDVAVGTAKDRRKLSDDFMQSLAYQQKLCQEYIEACLEWLRRPGRKKISFDPRADELSVIYEVPYYDDKGNLKYQRKEDTLQSLLNAAFPDEGLAEASTRVTKVKYLRNDPRDKILDALEQARKQNELIAKVTGELKEISQTTDVYRVVSIVIQALTTENDIPVNLRRKLIDDIEAGMALYEKELLEA